MSETLGPTPEEMGSPEGLFESRMAFDLIESIPLTVYESPALQNPSTTEPTSRAHRKVNKRLIALGLAAANILGPGVQLASASDSRMLYTGAMDADCVLPEKEIRQAVADEGLAFMDYYGTGDSSISSEGSIPGLPADALKNPGGLKECPPIQEMSEVWKRDVLPWITPDENGKFKQVSDDELFLDRYGGATHLGINRNQDLSMPFDHPIGMQVKIVGHEYTHDRLFAYGLIQDRWLGNLIVNIDFGSKDFYTSIYLGKGSRNIEMGRKQKKVHTAQMEKFLDKNPGIVLNLGIYPYHENNLENVDKKYSSVIKELQAQEDYAITAATWITERMSIPPVLNDIPEGIFNQPVTNFDPTRVNAFYSADVIYWKKKK